MAAISSGRSTPARGYPSTAVKRPADSSSGPPSKLQAMAGSEGGGGSGGGGIQGNDSDPQPIERPFRTHTWKLTLNWGEWMEITAGQMLWYRGSITFADIFPNFGGGVGTQRDNYKKLLAAFPYVKFGKLKVRMSNFIFLLDEVAATGSTPVTVTSITPQMYFVHATPHMENVPWFGLENRPMDGTASTRMDASIAQGAAPMPRGFNTVNSGSLESMCLSIPNSRPGTVTENDTNWGYDAAQTGSIDFRTAYNAPTVYNVSGQLVERGQMKFMNPGDCIEFECENNLEGKTFYSNDVTNVLDYTAGTSTAHDSFYVYPSQFRPLVSLTSQYDTTLAKLHQLAQKPIRHHFFQCPPIMNGNNAVLAQRVSMYCEQKLDIFMYSHEDMQWNLADQQLSAENAMYKWTTSQTADNTTQAAYNHIRAFIQ